MTSRRYTLGAVVCLLAATALQAAELRVSIAISFKPAAEAVLAARSDTTGILWNAGGSSILTQQLLRGAPADLIVTAGAMEMDRLEAAGLLVADSRTTLAGNRLVLVVPQGSTVDLPLAGRFAELGDGRLRRIALANPRTAPLGRYTAELLDRAGLTAELADRAVYAENARIALEYVARGDVDAGIVYATDVSLAQGRVRSADLFPQRIQPAVLYEAAVLRNAAKPEAAHALLDRLASPVSRAELRRRGWLTPQ